MSETAPPEQAQALKEARRLYKAKDRKTIAGYHRIVPAHPVLDVLLAFCVRYSLDPLGGHVWLVDENEGAAVNGEPAEEVRGEGIPLQVGVTRDGLLSVALRDERYEGMEFDAVRAKDTFKATRDGGDVSILHEYPDLAEDGAQDYRGEVVGAYCKTFVRGRKPTYFFAWMAEHGKFDVGDHGREFRGAWKYQSSMIIKSAQSVTLRLALGVTGAVGVDELRKGKHAAEEPPSAPEETPADFLAGLDLDARLREELESRVAAVNEASPNAWNLAKLKLRLGVEDPDARADAARRTVEELERELATSAAAA